MKKIIALLLVVALTAGIAVSGTLAYLTQDAGIKKNTFQVGGIDVTLEEEVGVVTTGRGTYSQNEEGANYTGLMPGDKITKKVTVTNEGAEDAYVRVTVKLNNAYEINSAIDEFYGDAAAQKKYDEIFAGWGLNHSKDLDGDGTNEAGMRLTITGSDMPEHVLHVDSVKTIDEYALFYSGNWFGEQEDIIPFDGYYTSDMNPYELKYTYYIFLPAGESTTLFDGLNIPKEFDANQLAMFSGLVIDIDADAIQAANVPGDDGTEGKAKAAFRLLNGGAAADEWDGTADTSWYNETDTEFTISTAEQLAGLADLVDGGNTFEGKTVKLGADIDLYCEDANGERVSFNPIGYGYDVVFKGTFDGQDNTISNMYQNGWSLGYSYGTQGGGLFASVVDATIKDLTIDGAEVVMECVDMGVLVGYSYGNCTYENILVSNSYIANYQRYTGGVVGEVNGTQTFKNVDVDASTTVGSLWGDFDASLGGIVGGKWGEATLTFEDCDVACEIDAHNDVISSYQWYAYRRAGMLIGNSEETATVDGRTSATASYLTARNCTVTYGDWVNYTYCEFAGTSWPYVRVQAGRNCEAYSNPRYGHPTDANGNKVVDDTHVHNDGEDHNILLAFDQLFGGGQGVYGTAAHDGVTVNYN